MAKALIISGDEGTRYLYQLAISYQKIQVEVAANIAEGIKKVQKFDPDLVVLDIMVPDIKDVAKLKELKGEATAMPIIIMTDMKNSSVKNEASILGAAKTMVKSESSLGDLIKTVRKVTQK